MADYLGAAADDEDVEKGYSWEKGMERTWEAVQEDEQGNLLAAPQRRETRRKRREAGMLRRGMIRYVALVLDCTQSMSQTDMQPSRLLASAAVATEFVREFYGENPISHLGIFLLHDGACVRLTRITGSPKAHVEALRTGLPAPQGTASLQNALNVTLQALQGVPEYASREVIVITGALSSRDASNIHETIDTLAANRVTVSVVQLAAEMFVCKRVAELTGGTATVARSKTHLQQLVLELTVPRPTSAQAPKDANMVLMGFPRQRVDTRASLCSCHRQLQSKGFACPRCHSRACDIPSSCSTCALPLVSSPHLARSYHHMFPTPPYEEVTEGPAQSCYGCNGQLQLDEVRFRCTACSRLFCEDCDQYVHDSLHNCPGCQ